MAAVELNKELTSEENDDDKEERTLRSMKCA